MLCKNCNYILTGKENFCPNCGTSFENCVLPFPKRKESKEKKTEVREAENKKITGLDGMVFPQGETMRKQEEPEIFKPDIEGVPCAKPDREGENEEKGSSAGKILVLILLCCILSVTAFGLADYFGITPRIAGLVSTFSAKNQVTQGNVLNSFSHESTIVAPDKQFNPETAYVFSGEGLILRKGPSNSFAPLHSLTDLTQVSILGGSLAASEWVYVFCAEKDSYGWLNGSFLCSEVLAESIESDRNAEIEEFPTAYYSEEYEYTGRFA